MKELEKIIEKLVEIIMHVGGFRSEKFTINDAIKELEYVPACPACLKLASELSALQESHREEKEKPPKHPTNWRDFTMTDEQPKCEECPSKQFYEANTAKIMDKIEQPEISVTDEEFNSLLNFMRDKEYNLLSPVLNSQIIFDFKAMRDNKIKQNGQSK